MRGCSCLRNRILRIKQPTILWPEIVPFFPSSLICSDVTLVHLEALLAHGDVKTLLPTFTLSDYVYEFL